MSFKNVFLELYVLLFLIAVRLIGANDVIMVVTRIGNCPGEDKLPVNIPDFKITQVRRGEYVLNGQIEFGLNVTKLSEFKGEIDVLKCQDARDDQKCVNFMTDVSDSNVCRLLQDEKAIYSPFMMSIRPRILCPVKQGVYKVVDRPVTGDMAKTVPVLMKTVYILTRVRLYYENRKIMCAYTRMHFTRKRARKQ